MKTRTVLNVPGGTVINEKPCTPRGTDAFRQLRAELDALAAIDEAIDRLDSLTAGNLTTHPAY